MKKVFLLPCAVLLFIAVAELPMWYYGLLRAAIFLVCLLSFFEETNNNNRVTEKAVLYSAIGLLFLVFHSTKGFWVIVDVGTGIFFIVEAIQESRLIRIIS